MGEGHKVLNFSLLSPWKYFNPWFTFACGALYDVNTIIQ